MLQSVMKALDILANNPSGITVKLVWDYVNEQSDEWKDLFHSLKQRNNLMTNSQSSGKSPHVPLSQEPPPMTTKPTVLSLFSSLSPDEGTYDQPADLSVLLDHFSINDWPDCDRLCSGEDRITRALEAHGFRCRWSTGESDSFGPLSRVLRLTHVDLSTNSLLSPALYFYYA